MRNLVLTILIASLGIQAFAQSGVVPATDLRLRKPTTPAGQYTFRHNADGVLRSYNDAGVQTATWTASTGTFDGNVTGEAGSVAAENVNAGTLGSDVVVQDGSLSSNIPRINATTNEFTGTLNAQNINGWSSIGTMGNVSAEGSILGAEIIASPAGSGISGPSANISGTVSADSISANYGAFESGLTGEAGQQVAYLNNLDAYAHLEGASFTGVVNFGDTINVTGSTTSDYFIGDGSGLTNLSVAAANITAGSLGGSVAVPGGNITGTATVNNSVLDSDLAALGNNSSTGLLTRTGAGTVAARTITAGSDITVTNGNGVSGNPTVAVGTNVVRFNSGLSFSSDNLILGSGYTSVYGGMTVQDYYANDHSVIWGADENYWMLDYGAGDLNLSSLTANGTIRSSGKGAVYNSGLGTYTFTVGDDLGNIGMGTPPTAHTLVIGKTTGNSALAVGQSNQRQLQFRWDYNATPANAVANLVTWGYGNPLKIDASVLSLQTNSAGGVSIGGAITANAPGVGEHTFQQGGSNKFKVTSAGTSTYGVSSTEGRSVAVFGTSAGTNNLPLNCGFISLSPSLGNTTVVLPTSTAPVGQEYMGSIINGGGGTYTVTFDAGSGNVIHGPGTYAQTYAFTTTMANQNHRMVRIVKLASTTWSLDTWQAN